MAFTTIDNFNTDKKNNKIELQDDLIGQTEDSYTQSF